MAVPTCTKVILDIFYVHVSTLIDRFLLLIHEGIKIGFFLNTGELDFDPRDLLEPIGISRQFQLCNYFKQLQWAF